MDLSRRSIVRALAGAPVIGSVMARAGVSGPLDASLPGKLVGGIGMAAQAAEQASANPPSERSYYARRIADLVKQVAGIGAEREKDILTRTRAVTRLDADLAANRSMALHVRMRIQAERDVDRDYSERRHWWQREIEETKERQSNVLGL